MPFACFTEVYSRQVLRTGGHFSRRGIVPCSFSAAFASRASLLGYSGTSTAELLRFYGSISDRPKAMRIGKGGTILLLVSVNLGPHYGGLPSRSVCNAGSLLKPHGIEFEYSKGEGAEDGDHRQDASWCLRT